MPVEPWKVLSSQQTFRDPYLSVRSDTCARADGHIIDPYHVIEAGDWVSVLALTPSGNVVLIREYRHGAGLVTVGLPSGDADAGDAGPSGAAVRELREETGYSCTEMIHVGSGYANWANHTNQVHYYLGFGAEQTSEQTLDSNEEIDVFEMPFHDFRDYDTIGAQHCLHAAALFYVERYFRKNPERLPRPK